MFYVQKNLGPAIPGKTEMMPAETDMPTRLNYVNNVQIGPQGNVVQSNAPQIKYQRPLLLFPQNIKVFNASRSAIVTICESAKSSTLKPGDSMTLGMSKGQVYFFSRSDERAISPPCQTNSTRPSTGLPSQGGRDYMPYCVVCTDYFSATVSTCNDWFNGKLYTGYDRALGNPGYALAVKDAQGFKGVVAWTGPVPRTSYGILCPGRSGSDGLVQPQVRGPDGKYYTDENSFRNGISGYVDLKPPAKLLEITIIDCPIDRLPDPVPCSAYVDYTPLNGLLNEGLIRSSLY
jgi:hypothetical protein